MAMGDFRRTSGSHARDNTSRLPHQGELRRVHGDTATSTSKTTTTAYVIPIFAPDDGASTSNTATASSKQHHKYNYELQFSRVDYEFARRLFTIMDTENQGCVRRAVVEDFCTLRCPVFGRRDEDLRKLALAAGLSSSMRSSSTPSSGGTSMTMSTTSSSPTFCQVWDSVVGCTRHNSDGHATADYLGVEGWLVLMRFTALAQYLEAKRRFSARHLQQTMRHRNTPRGSELVVVDVPPAQPPVPCTLQELLVCERQGPLPLPELDLDHSLVMLQQQSHRRHSSGAVHVELFGQASSSSGKVSLLPPAASLGSPLSNNNRLEFAISYAKDSGLEPLIVRRSMSDLKWLDETFTSQKVLGGTLCGRILPHFPRDTPPKSVLPSSLQKTTGGAISVATKGVGKIRDAAKSLWGSLGSASSLSMTSGGNSAASPSSTIPTSDHEHSATAPSIPQSNKKAMLSSKTKVSLIPDSFYNAHSPAGKARQLERYLNYLLEHPALSTSFPLNTILMASQSGLDAAKKALTDCANANRDIREQAPRLDDGKLRIPVPFLSSSNNSASTMEAAYLTDFGWVRTAAQAAIALRIHGMLETTGMPSASARLQHASLPSFPASRQWHDMDNSPANRRPVVKAEVLSGGFEDGVVQVSSGLTTSTDDEAYDLLPLPVPAPERRILNAGSGQSQGPATEARFHYGSTSIPENFVCQDEDTTVLLGSISIDDDIDKLREVIGSVDNTIRRCLASGGGIGMVRRDCLNVQLDIVKGFDGWEGMRGQFISQRSLLKGVNGLAQSKGIFEEGDLVLVEDLSWQSSLAQSAVSAAEDVRSAVRTSNTATNAKAAASNAAMSAQNACESANFSNMDEARATQTRSSIAQSHAIHAAVVDHEAKSVKRRAAVALANDVKCWNVHRKRELLRSALRYARAQHEATRRAVDAWSCLRDGFIDSVAIPPLQGRRLSPSTSPVMDLGNGLDAIGNATRFATEQLLQEPSEPVVSVFGRPLTSCSPPIVAVDHTLLGIPPFELSEQEFSENSTGDDDASKSTAFYEANVILPFATASPIGEVSDEKEASETEFADAEHAMTASMQSLVDGLMSWGGGIDLDDELILPRGMAASIALEASMTGSAARQMPKQV